MKNDDKTRYVCLGCKECMTVREVREDMKNENLCAKCKEAAQHKSPASAGNDSGKGNG